MTDVPYTRATPENLIVLGFTLTYIAIAAYYFFTHEAVEFTFYLAILLVLVIGIAWMLPKWRLPLWALWAMSVLGLLHALGGGIHVNGQVLYDLVLIPLVNNGENGITIWRFDQLVHPYGTAVAALITYYYLVRHSSLPVRAIAVMAALAAMGVGSINEVIEFAAKITIPHTDVGGYYNTLLDLCANMIGAAVGVIGAAVKWGRVPPE